MKLRSIFSQENIIPTLLALVVLLGAFFIIKGCQHEIDQLNIKDNTFPIVKPPKHYTDDSGYIHAEAPVVTAADVTAINTYYQGIIADLVKRLPQKTKPSDVQELMLVGSKDSASFKPKIDTVYKDGKPFYQSINYKSKWFKFNGNTHPDSMWHLVATDSIALLTYWKKSGFLRLKRELYIDGFSFNPDINVRGLSAIKLNAAQPKKWGIGFTVGYGVGKDFILQPFVGVGIQRNLIRF